jgi:hypothetical protein
VSITPNSCFTPGFLPLNNSITISGEAYPWDTVSYTESSPSTMGLWFLLSKESKSFHVLSLFAQPKLVMRSQVWWFTPVNYLGGGDSLRSGKVSEILHQNPNQNTRAGGITQSGRELD